MKIQLISDLHNRPDQIFQLESTSADLIVLAGDIDNGCKGLAWAKEQASRLGKEIIYIAGDHEFYDQEVDALIEELREQTQEGPVHFLEKSQYEGDGFRVLGCTFWYSAQGANDKRGKKQLANRLDEFAFIRKGIDLLDLDRLIQMHAESLQWLQDALEQPFAGQTIVVTHHAPTQHSWPWTWIRNGGGSAPNWARPAYCTDLEWFVKKYQPALWLHGHVHSACEYEVEKTRVVCNPHGFEPGEARGFEPMKLIELPI